MRSLKGLALGAAMALGALMPGQAAQAASSCGNAGPITIAEMTWLSAGTLAHITQHILSAGYGCDAKLVPGDTVPTATSMLTRSSPDIAPELWVSTVQSIWDKMIAKGNVYKAADTFGSGGVEGWWIPDYLAKAHPNLKSIEDLAANWKVFVDPSNPNKGRFYGCPPGWGCEIITNNLFKALDLKKEYDLFSPGSGANLKASIARAVAAHQPFVGYYWSPSEVIGKYHLVRLNMPAYDAKKFTCLTNANCPNPQVSGWATGQIAVAVVSKLKTEAPAAAAFLSKMTVPNDDINTVLAWGDNNHASTEDVAVYFLKNYPQIWTKWVPADVAAKVKASL